MNKVIYLIIVLGFFACKNQEEVKTVVDTTSVKIEPVTKEETIDFDFLQGKFDPSKLADQFIEIDIKHADGKGMFMQREAYDSFKKMFEHAQKDGINLQIRSATRNFDRQKTIWEKKWTGKTILSDGTDATNLDATNRALKILEYSSMPGTSRHHWGTDIDLNAFENSWFESGEGKKLYDWMLDYASDYGYCQPYTPKGNERPDGYNEEKWHWSYMPLSQKYTDLFADHKHKCVIDGFEGAETSQAISVVDKYILGINKACR